MPKEKNTKESKEKSEEPSQKQEKIAAEMIIGRAITENSDIAREFYNKSRFGKIMANGKVQLNLIEALYLIEKGKLVINDAKGREITTESFTKKAVKIEPNFWARFCVYKDIRNRGYIIKTALKFGADFRVYERGVKPGEDHAKWIVYPVPEASSLTWYEFAAKNRVAHSTKKRLLIGIVDDEDDVTYYEIRWVRP